MKRFWRSGHLATALLVGLGILLTAGPAVADILSFSDPTSTVQNMSTANNWLGNGQAWASELYKYLLIFEFIALAITTLLFRENVGEFFASVGLKVLLGGVYMWFVANAGSWAPFVIQKFQGYGTALGGVNSPAAFVSATLGSAAALYGAGALSVAVDASTAAGASATCVSVQGNSACLVGALVATASSHQTFSILTQAVAFMMMMSCAVIIIQFTLITIESFIIMGAGVLFIGFAGSRFTLPFSQGYFSYMLNVGVKLMAMYIILGVEQQLLPSVLLGTAAAVGTCCIPDGGSAALIAVGAAMWVAFQVMIGSALIAAVPGIASSLLTGQSTVSGAQALSGAMQQFSAGRQMAHERHAPDPKDHQLQQNKNTLEHASTSGAGGTSPQAAPDQSPTSASPGQNATQSFAPANLTSTGGFDQQNQAHTIQKTVPLASAHGLNGYTPKAIHDMSAQQFQSALPGTDYSTLSAKSMKEAVRRSDDAQKVIEANDIQGQIQGKEKQDEQQQGEPKSKQGNSGGAGSAYAISILAGAVPKEYASPTAVQVRLANPDKL